MHSVYSHGLENIYALETIDVRSIRKMVVLDPPAPQPKSPLKLSSAEGACTQMWLNMQPNVCPWIVPWVLQEPLCWLPLSKPLEKWVKSQGITSIGELRDASRQGLGQGHVQELEESLNNYLAGQPLYRSSQPCFLSLIRLLLAPLERTEVYLALEPYQLHKWIALTPFEQMEVKKIAAHSLQERRLQALAKVDRSRVRCAMQRIVSAFVYPWMVKRGGFASQEQIVSWLALSEEEAAASIRFLQELTPGLFDGLLPDFGIPKYFALEPYPMQVSYRTLLSYFVPYYTRYRYEELVAWAMHEQLMRWESVEGIESLLNSELWTHITDDRGQRWIGAPCTPHNDHRVSDPL